MVQCKQSDGTLLVNAWYMPSGESVDENNGRRYYFVLGEWRSKDLFASEVKTQYPSFVRCKDNTLHRDLLTVGAVYECSGEEWDNYRVQGHWLSKRRFEPATREEWMQNGVLLDRGCVILDGTCDCPRADGATFPVCKRYPAEAL